MFGIVLGIAITVVAVAVVIVVSCKEISNAKKRQYVCPKCGKEFSPQKAGWSTLNFGDGSKVVTCAHCGHEDRMMPRDR